MRIGVFDSGLGGLTVVRELRRLSSEVDVIYLGDTARVPYGIRSETTIKQYASECAQFLEKKGIDCLVVACNTVSALALDSLKAEYKFPVYGVIEPGIRAASEQAGHRPIGVLGTLATIDSGAYERALRAISPTQQIFSQAAPLLVPLVEEGWLEGEVPRRVIHHYLGSLLDLGIGALILGCTHYPLLKDAFVEELKEMHHGSVKIVDSGVALAQSLSAAMKADPGQREFSVFVTDTPKRFQRLAETFLGEPIQKIESVKLVYV